VYRLVRHRDAFFKLFDGMLLSCDQAITRPSRSPDPGNTKLATPRAPAITLPSVAVEIQRQKSRI
jgi:hypothetical protein